MEYEKKVLKYRAVRGKVESRGQAGSGTDGAGTCRAPAASGELSGESCEQALAVSAWKSQSLAAAFPGQPAGASLTDAQGITALPEQTACVNSCSTAWLVPRAPSTSGGWLGHRMGRLSAFRRAFDSVGLFRHSPLNGS